MSRFKIITKFCLSDVPPDLTGRGCPWHWKPFGSVIMSRVTGEEESMLDLMSDQDLQDRHGLEWVTSTRTPANKITGKLKKALQDEGITLQPGDDALNALRALRDKYSQNSPKPFGFDISD